MDRRGVVTSHTLTTVDKPVATVTLPGGYLDPGGMLHTDADITAMCGFEERMLGDPYPCRAAAATALLARCVKRIGTHTVITTDLTRDLLIGDRDYLIVMVHRLTAGSRLAAVIACPQDGCDQRMDVDYSLDDLVVDQCRPAGATFTVALPPVDDDCGAAHAESIAECRLPTGRDQEALAACTLEAPEAAVIKLLARCIVRLDGRSVNEEAVAGLAAAARAEIDREISERAPAVDVELQMVCPACRTTLVAPFAIVDMCLDQLRSDCRMLDREIHLLASRYHWSERDILALPRSRRRRYSELVLEEPAIAE